MLQSDLCAALESLPGLAGRYVLGIGFLDGPEGVVVMVAVEAGDGLLPGAGAVGELGGVEVEAGFRVFQADG